MKKSKIGYLAGLILTLSFVLTGCGSASTDVDTTTVIINKDGTVTESIVEPFDKDYYNADELNRSIESAVGAYNSANPEAVTLGEVIVEEGVAKTVLDFKDFGDYAAFNDVDFFTGTVSDAYSAGYTFPAMVDAAGNTITSDQILEKGDAHIVITNEAIDVITFSKILYVNSSVTAFSADKKATVNEGEVAYIIFQ